MENKKVGLCLAFKGTNYGQNLQAYALQQVVDKMGYDTEIIDYTSGKDKGIRISSGSLYLMCKIMLKKIKNIFIHKSEETYDQLHSKNNEERIEKANDFRKNFLHDIVQVNGYTNLKILGKKYDSVVVGSDQIWTPDIAFTNFYTLRFADNHVNKISYATSLGVSEYPNYAKKEAANFWKDINYLSVREHQGKNIVTSLVDKKVNVVVDPTYLITKDEWLELITDKKSVQDDYVLLYFLGDNPKAKELARQYAKDNNLKTVCILSNECNVSEDRYDEVLIGQSPSDFINLIRHAKCVFTDSFHGVAFSVINNKQFYVFYRVRKDIKGQRNSRIDNILECWGLKERLVTEFDNLNTTVIDYTEVNEKLKNMRNESMNFLKRALRRK